MEIGGGEVVMRRRSTLFTSVNLETRIKVEFCGNWGGEVVGDGTVMFCQQHTLFSHQELSILFDNTYILQNMTLALNFVCGHT